MLMVTCTKRSGNPATRISWKIISGFCSATIGTGPDICKTIAVLD